MVTVGDAIPMMNQWKRELQMLEGNPEEWTKAAVRWQKKWMAIGVAQRITLAFNGIPAGYIDDNGKLYFRQSSSKQLAAVGISEKQIRQWIEEGNSNE